VAAAWFLAGSVLGALAGGAALERLSEARRAVDARCMSAGATYERAPRCM
jgi:hypothetical protein